MRQALAGFGVAVVAATGFLGAQTPKLPGGVALSDLSWTEAQSVLTESSVVVIPLGAAAVEQGPHMKLNSGERLARYLASRVQAAASVVMAPPLTYHFYPAFLEYPGSTTLTDTTARDTTVEVVRGFARSGARRFYVLNTGTPTLGPLSKAALTLADEGILLGYTDPDYHVHDAVKLKQSPIKVAHADEAATSMMLYVDPSAVDMKKAVREYGPGIGPLTRKKDTPGVYSESGVLGDPTLATREKGQGLVDALLAGVLEDIENMRRAPLPVAKPATPPPPPPAPRPAARPEARQPNGCTPGDERTIRDVGVKFSYLWRQMDAENLALLFTPNGDMRHPDGTIERGQNVIRDNRRELFRKPEYRGSIHPVTLNDIRCLGPSAAIADGKWELRLDDSRGDAAAARGRGLGPGRWNAGWCTLVLVGGGGAGWSIEAWRYTVNPPTGEAPTTLKQPGFIGRGGGG
jgi:creatinine amidohydrolase